MPEVREWKLLQTVQGVWEPQAAGVGFGSPAVMGAPAGRQPRHHGELGVPLGNASVGGWREWGGGIFA